MTIVVDIMPKAKEYNSYDPDFVKVKKSLDTKIRQYIPLVEKLKATIQARYDAWETEQLRRKQNRAAPVTSSAYSTTRARATGPALPVTDSLDAFLKTDYNIIRPAELHKLLQNGSLSILVLDVRHAEDYIHGHIRWNFDIGPSGNLTGGVVNVEPDFLKQGSSAQDIEGYLQSFKRGSNTPVELFINRRAYDLIVYMDARSQVPKDSSILGKLVDALCNDSFVQLKRKPVLLSGGFEGWEAYLRSCGIATPPWVEIGEGFGRRVSKDISAPSHGYSGSNNLARSPYDYVASRTQPTPNGKDKHSSPHSGTHTLDSKHNPFSDRTNIRLGSATSAVPVIVGVDRPRTASIPPRIQSRFDDPFYRFHGSRPNLEANQPLQSLGSSTSSLKVNGSGQVAPAYPVLGQPNSYTSASEGSSVIAYPSTGSASLVPNPIPPPLPVKAGSRTNVYQPAPTKAYTDASPLSSIRPIPPHQPLPYRPPPLAPLSHAYAIRRSSSPSGSPSTTRFYGLPPTPPIPPKPTSTRGRMVQENSLRGSDVVPYSQLGPVMGMAGLKNLGNTCFMNCVLQCLSATVPLARYFLGGSYRRHLNRKNPLGTKGEVTDVYGELVRGLWSGQEGNVVTPTKFKNTVGTYHPSFRGNEQQDSQEFLAFLLDSLHEDLNIARRENRPADKDGDDDEDGVPDQLLLEKAWKRYQERNWSIIVDLFQGILKSKLRCLTCGKTSTTFNPFMYLTLPIPEKNQAGVKGGGLYLQECLDKFVEQEILDGDDAWRCPRCKVPRRSTKTLTIARLPTILLIHLKRFYFQGPFRNRIDTLVDFPFNDLDLTGYVADARHKQPPESCSYDLYAVASHYGGLNGGHYMAQVKNNYRGKWFNFDDSRLSVVDEREIKTSAAYILFYCKNSEHLSTPYNWWGSDPSVSRI
ncbi:hypothetical protein BC832DRAFT_553040 [Gaertneriomyces semiglobifer]|nr:hypothetical protein BC832DRAFT_553040 [Gaertneriomyces semiglobifer]